MTNTNLGQRIGAAGNQAAQVLAGAATQVPYDELVKMHADLTADFAANMQTLQDALEGTSGPAPAAPAQQSPAVQTVHRAFPGTTEVPAAQAGFPPSTAAPAPAPAPIPGAADGDPQVASIWQEFFADPSQFWDNRFDKRNPRSPDFKNKQNGDRAVWINDKKNPSWVPQQLAAAGYA